MPAEPLAEGWACKTFLARAASYARNRSEYSCLFHFRTCQAQINLPPFVRALDELRNVHTKAGAEQRLLPKEVSRQFFLGKAAIAISWPGALRTEEFQAGPFPFGIAPLPGATQRYNFSEKSWHSQDSPNTDSAVSVVPLLGISGRVAAIARTSSNLGGALDFLSWLSATDHGSQRANEQ